MKRTMISLILFSSIAFADSNREAIIQKIQPKVADFKKTLVGTLQQALKISTTEAIEVCKTRAPEIAKEKSLPNMKIGRTSFKLRNELNVTPTWAQPFLDKFKNSSAKSPMPPELVEIEGGKWGYVEPLYTQALCLSCHGVHLEKSVTEVLKKRYPKDQAIGFKEGELRGLVWVEYKQ